MVKILHLKKHLIRNETNLIVLKFASKIGNIHSPTESEELFSILPIKDRERLNSFLKVKSFDFVGNVCM